jgi:hypothetical protein
MRQKSPASERGSVILAILVLLLFVSVLVISMSVVTNSETQLAHTDVENTAAYYGAEAAMEKMVVDLSDLYTTQLAPNAATIGSLGASAFQPALPQMTYPTYSFTVQDTTPADGAPDSEVRTITGGANEGLIAQIIPIRLDVTARRLTGAEVAMRRDTEVG